MKTSIYSKIGSFLVGGGIFTLLSLQEAQAQQFPTNKAISQLPEKANGYLILDKIQNPNVVEWKLNISSIDYDSSSVGNFIFNHVETISLNGTNYIKLNRSYYTDGQYFINVVGNNSSGIGIVEEGPVQICNDCPTSFIPCDWGCVGKDYAYGLGLWVAPNNGSSFLDMSNYYPIEGPYEYYYQWVDGDDWSNFTGSNTNGPAYYGLGDFEYDETSNQIIKLYNVDYSDGLFDASNNVCTGLVYGIRKHYGPWQNAYGSLQSGTITSGNSNCNQNFTWAKNQVNSNSGQFTFYNVPQLSCNGYEQSPSGSPYFGDGPFIADDFVECIQWVEDAFEGENGNLWLELSQVGDCIDESSTPYVNDAFEWPSDLIAVTFKSNNGMTPIVITEDILYDQNGNFIADPIVLSRGFYNVGFQFSDNSYKTVFFERNTAISSDLEQADFLNVNIYEVPVEEDDFHLEMAATARVKFTYSLYDSQANLLFEQSYVIEKDTNVNDLIEVQGGIPSGVLINKFSFSDGSEIVLQTVK